MQTVNSPLLAVLESRERDLVDLFELYAPGTTTLTPANAAYLFAPQRIIWNGNEYTRQAITRGDVSRFMSEKFNMVSVTFSNVDRVLGTWLASTAIEGYRLLIRTISRSVDNDSLVLFIGRIEKPFEVDDRTVQLNAKQYLGSIEASLPFRQYESRCPLEFKQEGCLAGEMIGSKSAAYQAATACNKSRQQCEEYSNTEAFQGFRFQMIAKDPSFTVGYAAKAVVLTGGAIYHKALLKKLKRNYQSMDDTPYGDEIPLIFGRMPATSIPIVHADTGEYIAGQSVFCEGEIEGILNLKNVNPDYQSTFQFLNTHTGKYGTDSNQLPTGFFASVGDGHSRSAYAEYTVKGKAKDTYDDPAPDIVGMVMGMKVPVPSGGSYGAAEWSDNPVHQLRFLLTDFRSLELPAEYIDDEVALLTAAYCDEPILDTSNSEVIYLSEELQGRAGSNFLRYHSTGVLNTQYFRKLLGLTSTFSAAREFDSSEYNFFDPAAPPDNADIPVLSVLRKRYTSNFRIETQTKIVDFIFKSLLPAFRGYLVTSGSGKLQIRCEKPQLTQYLRSAVLANATVLPIEDADEWKALTAARLYVLIGVGGINPEVRRISTIDYSTAGNGITLATSVTGTITATASGATLSGGSTTTAATGTVTIGGSISAGNTMTVTINGVAVAYTITAADTTGTIAALVAASINANPTLNRYIKASWSVATPAVIVITAKFGTINLTAGTTNAHSSGAEIMHVHASFSHRAIDVLPWSNILRNSFKWPLGGRQSSNNRFVIKYNDAAENYQPTELRENDYDHQRRIREKKSLEINGACVDNFNQADRLVRGARVKHRDCDFFCELGSAGVALLLEEGDRVCIEHDSMPGIRHLPLTIEELKIRPDHRVIIIGRQYSKAQFPEDSTPKTVAFFTASAEETQTPGQPTGLTLTETTPGTVRGTFTFGHFNGKQTAKVEVRRAGQSLFEDTNIRVSPDSGGNGAFQISGLPSGTNSFLVTPRNERGDAGNPATADLVIRNPLSQRVEANTIASTVTFYPPTVSTS